MQQNLRLRQTLCGAEPTAVDTLHPGEVIGVCDLGHQERLQRREGEGDEGATINTGQEGEGPAALHTCLSLVSKCGEFLFKLVSIKLT